MTPETRAVLDAATLKAKADNAYCAYIETMRSVPCLGWEAKVRTGEFGRIEMTTHAKANVLLGRHEAYANAAKSAEAREQLIDSLSAALRNIRELLARWQRQQFFLPPQAFEDMQLLGSRLVAARAGQKELRGKASELKSIRDKFHAKHFLDEGDTELMDSLICEIVLMADKES